MCYALIIFYLLFSRLPGWTIQYVNKVIEKRRGRVIEKGSDRERVIEGVIGRE